MVLGFAHARRDLMCCTPDRIFQIMLEDKRSCLAISSCIHIQNVSEAEMGKQESSYICWSFGSARLGP